MDHALGHPATLAGDTREEVGAAQRDMARIGIDPHAGAVTGGPKTWAPGGELRSYAVASFTDLADAVTVRDVTVLDVRRVDEWDEGHVEGAVHVPLHDPEARLGEIPRGEVWVHCHSGYRAAVAASLLDRDGRAGLLVDDQWAAISRHDALQPVRAA